VGRLPRQQPEAIDHELVETGEEQPRRQAILAAVGGTGPVAR